MFGGAGAVPPFFTVIAKPEATTLKTIRGMAWDITLLRITERIAGARRNISGRKAEFFVPFIASYDKKFKLLIQACPVSAIITEPELGMTTTVFRDELQFRQALETAKADQQLGTFAEQFERIKAELDSQRLETETARLEQELERVCLAAASPVNNL